MNPCFRETCEIFTRCNAIKILINKVLPGIGEGFWFEKKQKGNRQLSVPLMWRIWEKDSVLTPNPFPQKGGEKVL
jgi:hypothetical protein